MESTFLLNLCLYLLLASLVTSQSSQRTSACNRRNKSPLPSGLRCGAYGTLTAPQVLSELTTLLAPIDNCRDQCLDRSDCLTFSVTGNRCRLFKAAPAAMGFQANTGNVRFWERGCFDAACTTSVQTFLTSQDSDYDDQVFQVELPFPIRMYGRNATRVWMSMNGWLSLDLPSGGGQAGNSPLPSYDRFPGTTIFVFWTDLRIRAYSQRPHFEDQYMSWTYTINPVNGYRRLRFTWLARYPYSNPQYQVNATLQFLEGRQDPFIFYDDVGDDLGAGVVVGSQSSTARQYSQYRDSQIFPKLNIAFFPFDANPGGAWH